MLVVLEVDVAEAGEGRQKDEGGDPADELVHPAVPAGGDGPGGGGGGWARVRTFLFIYTYVCICVDMNLKYIYTHDERSIWRTCARRRAGA